MNGTGQNRCTRSAVFFAFALLLFALGCTEPLHHDLDEGQANEMVVVLSQHGFEAEKLRDPYDNERWAVSVPNVQRVDAWAVLKQEGLPRKRPGGFDDFYPGGGLIPTAQEERVVLQYATAREIQTSLMKVDGVIDAHVNLVLPEKPRVQMSNTVVSQPRASVLVQWRDRGGDPPLSKEEIKRLVSGGVEGLEQESVHVVLNAVAAPPERPQQELASLGPLNVAPSSAAPLKGLILFMGFIIIALSSGLVYLVLTGRRTREGA